MARRSTTDKKKVNLEDVMVVDDTTDVDITNVSGKKVDINDGTLINVKSNVFGTLVYIDKKSGDETTWPTCGTVQTMTFGQLRSMKASQPGFFKNQWIIIVGFAENDYEEYTIADIYKALYITNYYKNYINPTNYEEVCGWTPDEIKANVSLMSEDAKTNMVVALNTYIEKGLLDSLKAIKAFETALGCELRRPE